MGIYITNVHVCTHVYMYVHVVVMGVYIHVILMGVYVHLILMSVYMYM